MINRINHQHNFQILCKQFDSLLGKKVIDAKLLQQTLERLLNYLTALEEHISGQAKLLKERQSMLLHFPKEPVDANLSAHFLADQLHYLTKWYADFESAVFQSSEQCQLNLSVREVLYLIRLLRDAGLLEKEELKHTYRFLGNNFRTAQQELLSVESLRKKYSQLDKRIMHNTTALLARLAELNKTYLLAAKSGTV